MTSADFIPPGSMVVGTCGSCGGPVTCPANWMAIIPPTKQCARCGMVAVESFGAVLPMRTCGGTITTTTTTGIVSTFAVLLCLLVAGCVRVPVTPSPEPDVPDVEPQPAAAGTIDSITAMFNLNLRQAYSQSAANIETGKWTTEEQLFDGETLLIDRAYDAAVQPLANRMQAEVGGKSLKEQAAFRRKIAEERR